MLIDVADVLALDEYAGADSEAVERKILGIESAIRAYTNNDFTVRGVRIKVPSANGVLNGTSPYLRAGDRVLIADSGKMNEDGKWIIPVDLNEGLYDVESVSSELGYTALDETLFDADYNDVFLVRYPEAIKVGVLELLKWEATGRDKVGVASESISRHSVSYYQFSNAEMLMGYPASLMGFLKPFVKARF